MKRPIPPPDCDRLAPRPGRSPSRAEKVDHGGQVPVAAEESAVSGPKTGDLITTPPAVSFVVPVRTRSTLNLREHWRARAERMKLERRATWAASPSFAFAFRWSPLGGVHVTLTRIAPRTLDGDNLQGALKAVRDQVASMLGVDDGDPRIEWRYAQERGKPREYAVRVEVRPVPEIIPQPGGQTNHRKHSGNGASRETPPEKTAEIIPSRVRPEDFEALEEVNLQLAKTGKEVDALRRKLGLESEPKERRARLCPGCRSLDGEHNLGSTCTLTEES